MTTVTLSSRPRPRPQGFLRSLAVSGVAHGGLLGAGVLFGLVFAAGGRGSAPREYVAHFELGSAAAAFEEPVETLEPSSESEVVAEPELLSPESWGESTPLAEDLPEPTRLRSTDWVAARPFLTGSVARPAPPPASSPASAVAAGAAAALTAPAPGSRPELAMPPGPPAPLVVEPVAVHRPAPVYPRLARRAGEEGSVLCRLHLSAAGTVERVEVVESSGSVRLDEAAREALAGWRFEPRREDGSAVPGTHLHRVTFRLDA